MDSFGVGGDVAGGVEEGCGCSIRVRVGVGVGAKGELEVEGQRNIDGNWGRGTYGVSWVRVDRSANPTDTAGGGDFPRYQGKSSCVLLLTSWGLGLSHMYSSSLTSRRMVGEEERVLSPL